MNLILTSDFPSTECGGVLDHMRRVASRPRIAWIPPVTDAERERFRKAQAQFKPYGFENLEYYDIDLEADEERLSHLEQYDIVYLSGGDPLRFRANMSQTNLAARLLYCLDKGRLLVAASGGSLQFTKNLSLFRLQLTTVDKVFMDRGEYEALGLVGYELLPHLNRFDGEFLERVRQYSERVGHDIVAIEDGSAVIHCAPDDYRCVGSAMRFRNGLMRPIGTAA